LSWSDAALAGAFVLGVTAGAVASIRITKHVLEYMRREQRDP
jgi:hypothetical protein